MALSRRSQDVERRRRSPTWQKDKHVVGLAEDARLLLEKAILEQRQGSLFVASIIGMGGIGKTTLARVMYSHVDITSRFDCCNSVCVSNEFSPKEILKELGIPMLEPTDQDKLRVMETMEKLQVPKLQQMLPDRLQGKRYFIDLDDVWEDTHWESPASAFPDEVIVQGNKASRLLLTSRNWMENVQKTWRI